MQLVIKALRLTPATAGTYLEPNNLMPPENCAGANVSQPAGLQATGQKALNYRPDGAGLWEDRPCSERHEFICEVLPNAQYEPYTASTGYTFKWVPLAARAVGPMPLWLGCAAYDCHGS
jgi:hypothetical protein